MRYIKPMRRLLIIAMATMLFGGCGEADKAKPANANVKDAPQQVHKTYLDMAADDVVVIVNGNRITKGDMERQISVQCELFKLAKPNAKISDVDKQAEKLRRKAIKNAIERCMMVNEAKKRGIVASAEDRKKMRDNLAKVMLKGKIPSFATLESKFTAEQRQELNTGIDLDIVCQKMNAILRKETAVKVTPEDAEKRRKDLFAYNERARKSEAEIWQNASNVWQCIQKGKDFAKVAENCSKDQEHIKSDMDWGEFDLEFFKGDAELCHYLEIMPEGTVTPPVLGDGGLVIVKLLKRIPANFGAGQVHPRYELANIFFDLPKLFTVGKVEDVQKEMTAQLSEDAFREQVKKLVHATKIEYPNGEVEVTLRKVRPHKHGPNCKHSHK